MDLAEKAKSPPSWHPESVASGVSLRSAPGSPHVGGVEFTEGARRRGYFVCTATLLLDSFFIRWPARYEDEQRGSFVARADELPRVAAEMREFAGLPRGPRLERFERFGRDPKDDGGQPRGRYVRPGTWRRHRGAEGSGEWSRIIGSSPTTRWCDR